MVDCHAENTPPGAAPPPPPMLIMRFMLLRCLPGQAPARLSARKKELVTRRWHQCHEHGDLTSQQVRLSVTMRDWTSSHYAAWSEAAGQNCSCWLASSHSHEGEQAQCKAYTSMRCQPESTVVSVPPVELVGVPAAACLPSRSLTWQHSRMLNPCLAHRSSACPGPLSCDAASTGSHICCMLSACSPHGHDIKAGMHDNGCGWLSYLPRAYCISLHALQGLELQLRIGFPCVTHCLHANASGDQRYSSVPPRQLTEVEQIRRMLHLAALLYQSACDAPAGKSADAAPPASGWRLLLPSVLACYAAHAGILPPQNHIATTHTSWVSCR